MRLCRHIRYISIFAESILELKTGNMARLLSKYMVKQLMYRPSETNYRHLKNNLIINVGEKYILPNSQNLHSTSIINAKKVSTNPDLIKPAKKSEVKKTTKTKKVLDETDLTKETSSSKAQTKGVKKSSLPSKSTSSSKVAGKSDVDVLRKNKVSINSDIKSPPIKKTETKKATKSKEVADATDINKDISATKISEPKSSKAAKVKTSSKSKLNDITGKKTEKPNVDVPTSNKASKKTSSSTTKATTLGSVNESKKAVLQSQTTAKSLPNESKTKVEPSQTSMIHNNEPIKEDRKKTRPPIIAQGAINDIKGKYVPLSSS